MQSGENFLYTLFMKFISGGCPTIVVHSQFLPESNKFPGITGGQSGNIDALLISGLLHLLPVLVDPC